MPEFFQYLIKLSINLTVLYLFYFFVLRRLTFYNYNRWYLLGYSILSFFIAAINIAPFVQSNTGGTFTWIQLLPTLQQLASGTPQAATPESITTGTTWQVWDYIGFILVGGIVFLMIRLFIQILSFNKIRRNASRIPANGIDVYQVNAPIIPFSFGKSIYINSQLHAPHELEKIIQHEFVHVKQKHSIDIICSEIICFLNWYNPFAWLIRKAIRQNLEYIADNQVIQTGINKKEYQYLLLKVIGNQKFSIAAPFNFSSLKKRIAMMNKLKTSKVHALKFLFMLPLLATVLLAFRSELADKHLSASFTYGGIVMDDRTGKPLTHVKITEQNSGQSAVTDEHGFFSFKVNDLVIDHQLSLDGKTANVHFTYSRAKEEARSFLVLVKAQQNDGGLKVLSSSIAMEWDGSLEEAIKSGKNYAELEYVQPVVESAGNENLRLESKGGVMGWYGDKPNQDMHITADTINIIMDKPKGLVIYADKLYTAAEYKSRFSNTHVTGVYFFSKENAAKIWGNKAKDGVIMINDNPSFQQYTNGWKLDATDTVPKTKKYAPNNPYPDTLQWVTDGRAKHDDFMDRHPEVKYINWNTRQRNAKTKEEESFINLTLNSGVVEKYNLLDDKDLKRFKDKYGELPVQAPPPPTPPASPTDLTAPEPPTPPAAPKKVKLSTPAPPPTPPTTPVIQNISLTTAKKDAIALTNIKTNLQEVKTLNVKPVLEEVTIVNQPKALEEVKIVPRTQVLEEVKVLNVQPVTLVEIKEKPVLQEVKIEKVIVDDKVIPVSKLKTQELQLVKKLPGVTVETKPDNKVQEIRIEKVKPKE